MNLWLAAHEYRCFVSERWMKCRVDLAFLRFARRELPGSSPLEAQHRRVLPGKTIRSRAEWPAPSVESVGPTQPLESHLFPHKPQASPKTYSTSELFLINLKVEAKLRGIPATEVQGFQAPRFPPFFHDRCVMSIETLTPLPIPRTEPVAAMPQADVLRPEGLGDVFDFAAQEQLPVVPWLSQLGDQDSRVNLHSLEAGTRFLKRACDLVIATSMLIVLSPVMLLTALLVKLTSPGPAIFRQTRVGLNLRQPGAERRVEDLPPPEGEERRIPESDRRREFTYGRHFTLYKFRSMRNDAEKNGAQFAVKGDARVTPLGSFMRKTRLDELPQLWNVIRGDMSLVGPRPERPEFIKELSTEIPDYLERLGLKPGLTGVAQIVNGYDNNIDSFRRKVAFDLMYLRNCCLWNDLKVLFRTIGVVLSGSGAL